MSSTTPATIYLDKVQNRDQTLKSYINHLRIDMLRLAFMKGIIMKYALALVASLLATGYATASALDTPDTAGAATEQQGAPPTSASAAPINSIPLLLLEGDDHKIPFREQNEVPPRTVPVEEIQMIASHNAEGGLATTVVIDASHVLQQAYLHKPAMSNKLRQVGIEQKPNPAITPTVSTPVFASEPHAVATEVVKASGYIVAYVIDSPGDAARSVRIPINQVSTRVYEPSPDQPYKANAARVSLPEVSVQQIVQQAAAAPAMTLAEMADELTAGRELAAQMAAAGEQRAATITAATLARMAELAPSGAVATALDKDAEDTADSTNEAETEAEAESGSESEPYADAEAESDSENKVDAQTQTDAEAAVDAQTEPDADAADTDTEREVEDGAKDAQPAEN